MGPAQEECTPAMAIAALLKVDVDLTEKQVPPILTSPSWTLLTLLPSVQYGMMNVRYYTLW